MRVEQQEQARHNKLDRDDALQSFHNYVYAQLDSPRKDERPGGYDTRTQTETGCRNAAATSQPRDGNGIHT